jgi:hypothetical protein
MRDTDSVKAHTEPVMGEACGVIARTDFVTGNTVLVTRHTEFVKAHTGLVIGHTESVMSDRECGGFASKARDAPALSVPMPVRDLSGSTVH